MSVAVVETREGVVLQVISCSDTDTAEDVAKQLCEKNGIVFEGSLSCLDNPTWYSVQICLLEKN